MIGMPHYKFINHVTISSKPAVIASAQEYIGANKLEAPPAFEISCSLIGSEFPNPQHEHMHDNHVVDGTQKRFIFYCFILIILFRNVYLLSHHKSALTLFPWSCPANTSLPDSEQYEQSSCAVWLSKMFQHCSWWKTQILSPFADQSLMVIATKQILRCGCDACLSM